VLPYAVEGVGVPVDPLAFAGLLGAFVRFLSLSKNFLIRMIQYANQHVFIT
jgi:hypothetical protein